jgi:hypothetical protein
VSPIVLPMLTIAYGTAMAFCAIRSQPITQGSGRCGSNSECLVSGNWSAAITMSISASTACDSRIESSCRFSACQISTVVKPLPPETVRVGELGR